MSPSDYLTVNIGDHLWTAGGRDVYEVEMAGPLQHGRIPVIDTDIEECALVPLADLYLSKLEALYACKEKLERNVALLQDCINAMKESIREQH